MAGITLLGSYCSYVAPGSDCSPGSDVVSIIQIKSLIVILK